MMPGLTQGQWFNIGGDGVSDTAFYWRLEEYFNRSSAPARGWSRSSDRAWRTRAGSAQIARPFMKNILLLSVFGFFLQSPVRAQFDRLQNRGV